MPRMSTPLSSEILKAAEHLSHGTALHIQGVSWQDYEHLLEGLGGRPRLRVSYNRGRLEVVSPSKEHEMRRALIEDLVMIACEELALHLVKTGSATWKRQSLAKGVEPDAAYYVRNADRISGYRIDLETDPPPDIVVEVDVTNDTLSKLSIYAALGIPEVWHYHGHSCHFFELTGSEYEEISVSRFLHGLTARMLTMAIDVGATRSQDAARKEFRRLLRAARSVDENSV